MIKSSSMIDECGGAAPHRNRLTNASVLLRRVCIHQMNSIEISNAAGNAGRMPKGSIGKANLGNLGGAQRGKAGDGEIALRESIRLKPESDSPSSTVITAT